MIRTSIYIKLMLLLHQALSVILFRYKSLLKLCIYIHTSFGCHVFWVSFNIQHTFPPFPWVSGLFKKQLFTLHSVINPGLLLVPSRCLYLEIVCLLLSQRAHSKKLPSFLQDLESQPSILVMWENDSSVFPIQGRNALWGLLLHKTIPLTGTLSYMAILTLVCMNV